MPAAKIALRPADGRDVNSLVIASREPDLGGVDALSANYLAGAVATRLMPKAKASPAPVLLTRQATLPTVTAEAIDALLKARRNPTAAAKIYVIGGENAVSTTTYAEIEAAAKDSGADVTVKRVAGDDRYATDAMAATDADAGVVSIFSAAASAPAEKTAFVANGLSTADALSAGPIAYRSHLPVLLTRTGSIPQATLDAMTTNNIKNVILLGDTTVASDALGTQLDSGGYTVTRLSGPDRYGTNTALYNFATKATGGTETDSAGGLGYTRAATPLLTNGLGFADALAAGPLAAEGTFKRPVDTKADTSKDLVANSPLLLTSPNALSTPTSAYLTANKTTVTAVTGVGLTTALPESVLLTANTAAE